MKNYEIDRLKTFITLSRWVSAKTYEKTAPHEYTVKAKATPDLQNEFSFMFDMIAMYGVPEKFFTRYYLYLYFEGYKYWVMDKELEKVEIINRVKV